MQVYRSIRSTRKQVGQQSPLPSHCSLCIEDVDSTGACAYGYACVYSDTISWASPTEPLPMVRDPRVAFERLFGDGATAKERAERRALWTRASSTESLEILGGSQAILSRPTRLASMSISPMFARLSIAFKTSNATTRREALQLCPPLRWAFRSRMKSMSS
jgi:hypothetical protein